MRTKSSKLKKEKRKMLIPNKLKTKSKPKPTLSSCVYIVSVCERITV